MATLFLTAKPPETIVAFFASTTNLSTLNHSTG